MGRIAQFEILSLLSDCIVHTVAEPQPKDPSLSPHEIDFSAQRGHKKFSKADPEKQTVFVEDLKKTPKSET
ncbi:MAG: hypothetical protein A2Z58_03795 [Planctomycetes bacterium RIFCSPHIGHO2_12_42_15]|nr:MAG: hypothetical protein A2Z58_03795 [Planctomycetes bacterium RIFCSPHIGHO2_12_42_15]